MCAAAQHMHLSRWAGLDGRRGVYSLPLLPSCWGKLRNTLFVSTNKKATLKEPRFWNILHNPHQDRSSKWRYGGPSVVAPSSITLWLHPVIPACGPSSNVSGTLHYPGLHSPGSLYGQPVTDLWTSLRPLPSEASPGLYVELQPSSPSFPGFIFCASYFHLMYYFRVLVLSAFSH